VIKLSVLILGTRIYKAYGWSHASEERGSEVAVTLAATAVLKNILLGKAMTSVNKKVQNTHIF